MCDELPPLKRWSQESITEQDWDFADFCQAVERAASGMPESESPFLIARAFAWELDRELGSGNGPFDLAKELDDARFPVVGDHDCQLTLLRQNAPTLAVPLDAPLWLFKPRTRAQPLNEWHLAELGLCVTPDTYEASRGTNDICALEIPWSDHEDEVVEAFRLWLRQHRGGTAKNRKKPGRKHEWRTWFDNLAIYRLSQTGYQRTEVLKRLGNKTMSAQNYSRAKRLVRREIKRRFAEMWFKSQRVGTEAANQGGGGWKRFFLK